LQLEIQNQKVQGSAQEAAIENHSTGVSRWRSPGAPTHELLNPLTILLTRHRALIQKAHERESGFSALGRRDPPKPGSKITKRGGFAQLMKKLER